VDGRTRSISGGAPVSALLLAVAMIAGAAGCRESSAEPAGTNRVLSAVGTNATIAAAPDGSASYVVWLESAEEGSDVLLARIGVDGAPLAQPIRVNHRTGDADPHEQAPPQVRVGPEGEVYVLWQKKVRVEYLPFGASELRFSRSSDGGRTFSPAITIVRDDGPPARRTFHDLAVAADGSLYVSWIDAGERDSARALHGAAHGTHPSHGHGGPAAEPGTEIRVAKSVDGGQTFGEPVVVDEACCPCCRTSLAVAPDGTVYIAYRKIFDGDVRDIAIARSTDEGRSFTAPRALHPDGWVFPGCPHAGPSLAVDADGTVHAAWYTGREGAAGIRYAYSVDRADSFSEPRYLAGGDWMPPSLVKLATQGNSVWAVWDDRRIEEGSRLIRLQRIRDARGGVPADDGIVLTGSSPDLALVGGSPTLVWQAGNAVRAWTHGVN
jgi:hypothetical protein